MVLCHFMALAFHLNIPFLFNNLVYFILENFFPKKPWDLEPCRETVRNEKKSWDSRQNRERWQVCGSVNSKINRSPPAFDCLFWCKRNLYGGALR